MKSLKFMFFFTLIAISVFALCQKAEIVKLLNSDSITEEVRGDINKKVIACRDDVYQKCLAKLNNPGDFEKRSCRSSAFDDIWLTGDLFSEMQLRLLGICHHPPGMVDDADCFKGPVHNAENEDLFEQACKKGKASDKGICDSFQEVMSQFD
ncbi:MAG: hypothetical protein ABIA04_06840 [Pseudomonadota bacterium]